MMRPKYYIRLIGQMNLKKSFVPLIFIVILVIVFSTRIIKSVVPIIKVTIENQAKAIGIQVTEETINSVIESINYDKLIDISYNDQGKVVAISANTASLNKLSSEIACKIQERLNNLDKVTVNIPLGELFGLKIFSGYGPDINIKIVPVGNVNIKYESEFLSEGINQTRHTINLNTQSYITIIAPFVGDTVCCNSTVTIAETVIIGDIPNTYYNINGLESFKDSGAIEIMK